MPFTNDAIVFEFNDFSWFFYTESIKDDSGINL